MVGDGKGWLGDSGKLSLGYVQPYAVTVLLDPSKGKEAFQGKRISLQGVGLITPCRGTRRLKEHHPWALRWPWVFALATPYPDGMSCSGVTVEFTTVSSSKVIQVHLYESCIEHNIRQDC